MQPFHLFWFKIGLEGRNTENNGNGAFLNIRIYVHLILAKGCGLSGYNSPRSSICFNLLMHNLLKVIFPPSPRLLHERELQSGAHRKSNTTRCVPSEAAALTHTKGKMETNENILQSQCFASGSLAVWCKGWFLRYILTEHRELWYWIYTSYVIFTLQVQREPCTWIVLWRFFNKLGIHYTNK